MSKADRNSFAKNAQKCSVENISVELSIISRKNQVHIMKEDRQNISENRKSFLTQFRCFLTNKNSASRNEILQEVIQYLDNNF